MCLALRSLIGKLCKWLPQSIWSAGPLCSHFFYFVFKWDESCSVSVRASIIQFKVISLFQTGAALCQSFDLLLLKSYCGQDLLRPFTVVNVCPQHFRRAALFSSCAQWKAKMRRLHRKPNYGDWVRQTWLLFGGAFCLELFLDLKPISPLALVAVVGSWPL